MSINSVYSELKNCFTNYDNIRKRKSPPPSTFFRKVKRIFSENYRVLGQLATIYTPIDPLLARQLNDLSSRGAAPPLAQSIDIFANRLSHSILNFPHEIWRKIFCSLLPEELKKIPHDVSKEWNQLLNQTKYEYLAEKKVRLKDLNFLSLNRLIECLAYGREKLTYVDFRDLPIRGEHIRLLADNCPNIKQFFSDSHFIYNADLEHIVSFKKLEILSLEKGNLSCMPGTIAQLTSLKKLSLLNCANLTKLPGEITEMTQLVKLDLSGSSLKSLPEGYENLSNLKTLVLENCVSFQFPENKIFYLRGLKTLKCSRLRNSFLLNNLENLSLKKLAIYNRNFHSMEKIGSLSLLTSLEIISDNLKELPSSYNCLNNLRTFVLKSTSIEKCPSFESYPYLKELGLELNVQDLHPSIFRLPLKILLLDFGFYARNKLLEEISEMTGLREVTLKGINFKRIPSKIRKLKNLEIFKIKNLTLRTISAEIGKLKNLRTLVIKAPIYGLPESLQKLKKLKSLKISSKKFIYFSLLNYLPLESLAIEYANLKTLTNLEKISTLTKLKLKNNSEFPSALKAPNSLKTLKLNCGLSELPSFFYQLTQLKKLDIRSWLYKNIEIKEDISNLAGLECLIICAILKKLPKNFSLLPLRELTLHESNMTRVPKCLGQISTLQVLSIYSNSEITRLPNSLGMLENIQSLHLGFESEVVASKKRFTVLTTTIPNSEKIIYYFPKASLLSNEKD